MFVEAIEKIKKSVKAIYFIYRTLGSEIIQKGCATLFFINDEGIALTCRHVVYDMLAAQKINENYNQYKKELEELNNSNANRDAKRKLMKKFNYNKDSVIQSKILIPGVGFGIPYKTKISEKYDLGTIEFTGIKSPDYGIFGKNLKKINQGKFMCRYGFPFAEFSNYKYNKDKDDIEWTSDGIINTPSFPIEGMITRFLGEKQFGIELSTPGLRGQSGGPLFDEKGIIYGIQYATNSLHLGFDMKNKEIMIGGKMENVNNQPFLHVGYCIDCEIIKSFLDENNIKYHIED